MVGFETERMFIRDVRASDADAFYRHMRRERYWRDLLIGPPTPECVAAIMNRCLRNQAQNPRTNYFLAAVDKRSDQLVGEAGLYVRDIRGRQGEIGWSVGSSHIGQGLATEIGGATLRYAFCVLGLRRVIAKCSVENHASRRIMAKLGMREEGAPRENALARGEWRRFVQCSILSSDWAETSEVG